MNFIKRGLRQAPFLMTLFLVILGVAISKVPIVLFSEFLTAPFIPWLGIIGRVAGATIFIGLLFSFSWAKEAGINNRYSNWHKHWFIVISPMLVIGLINLSGVQWDGLQISWTSLITLIVENFAVGLFEEVMMRGFVFYMLYRAWHQKSNGLINAALVQALIFGLLHLINLASGLYVDVIAQVIYATLLGIGFAGVVAYTRTIWTAVFVHSFINIIGSINYSLVPSYVDSTTTISTYAIMITAIFIMVTLPGIWCLKKAKDYKIEGFTV